MLTIYHNPACSKSREAMSLTQQFSQAHGLALRVVDYQKTPLTIAQLSTLRDQLGGAVRDMVRENDDDYARLELSKAGDAAILEALATHPKLLQRPIVVYADRAVIGRPTERVQKFLNQIAEADHDTDKGS